MDCHFGVKFIFESSNNLCSGQTGLYKSELADCVCQKYIQRTYCYSNFKVPHNNIVRVAEQLQIQ